MGEHCDAGSLGGASWGTQGGTPGPFTMAQKPHRSRGGPILARQTLGHGIQHRGADQHCPEVGSGVRVVRREGDCPAEASFCLHLVFLFLGIFLVGEHAEQVWHDHGIHSQRNLKGAMEKDEGSRKEEGLGKKPWKERNHHLQVSLFLRLAKVWRGESFSW